jgi:MFS family permease
LDDQASDPPSSYSQQASAFTSRPFAFFWAANCLMVLAVQTESVTIAWQVYAVARQVNSVKESAFLVGMVGLAQFIPLFLLTLPAGSIADRSDRRIIMLACAGTEMACVVALAAFALHPLPGLTPIFVVAALLGASRAFLGPASGALAPMLVPRSVLARAISWNAMGDQGALIVGPWIGGALCAFSPALAYSGSFLLYAGASLAILMIRADCRPVPQPGSHLEQIVEGIAYVRTNRIVLGAISLDLFAVLLGGATALLPVFASDVLDVGANGFGILRSGPAVGAGIMAFVLSRYPIRRSAGRFMFAGVAAFGAATLVFAVSRSMALSVAALAILGAADMISVYIRQTLVLIVTPDSMRGRVSAVSGLFISCTAELGEFETGVVARLIGPVAAAIFGGVGTLAVTGLWAWLFPELRKADRLDRREA